MNLPDYNFLSAPLWLVTVLHWLTLTLHFLAMNFVLGGGAVLLLGKLDDKWTNPVVQRFLRLWPTLMAATITFGVAPLLFLQLTFYRQTYAAAIVSAWPLLLILVAIIAAYYLFYGAAFKKRKGYSGLIAIALLCMLYVAFIYSSLFSMAERPGNIMSTYSADQSGTIVNPYIGSYIFRWLHMILGAITVGSFFVGLLGRDHPRVFLLGRNGYLVGMIAAMIAGMAYLLSLGTLLGAYMHSAAIWVVAAAFILSLASLHFFFRKSFLIAGLAGFLSLFGMVINRHLLRLIALKGKWDPSTIPVRPQWSALLVFLVCFVLALGLAYYMLKLYFREGKTTPEEAPSS